jgi:hypothetical protein
MADDPRQKIVDEMNEVLRSRKEEIISNYPLIRDLFQKPYKMPELDPLRHEVGLCLILGLNQAAITLTNHLLETFLKLVLIYDHTNRSIDKTEPKKGIKSLVDDFSGGIAAYNNKDLDFTINRACTVGLITKDQKKQLHAFRENFRNAYGHSDKKKLFGDSEVPVQAMRFEVNEIVTEPEAMAKVFDIPIFQGLAQHYHAKANAAPYFRYLDGVIRETLRKMFPSIDNVEVGK